MKYGSNTVFNIVIKRNTRSMLQVQEGKKVKQNTHLVEDAPGKLFSGKLW